MQCDSAFMCVIKTMVHVEKLIGINCDPIAALARPASRHGGMTDCSTMRFTSTEGCSALTSATNMTRKQMAQIWTSHCQARPFHMQSLHVSYLMPIKRLPVIRGTAQPVVQPRAAPADTDVKDIL